MSFTAVDIPQQTRARKARLTDDELKELVRLLKAGKTPSDGKLYQAKGKSSAKTRAYSAGYAVREELAGRSDLAAKAITVRTWSDGDGCRWALAMKTAKK